MSGIAGIWRKHSVVDQESIASMLQTIFHRGPDLQGTRLEENAALGACLLNTTPESIHEKAVAEDFSGRFLIVWDGRLDNRAELQARLPTLSETSTDPEFILEAYRAWGHESFSKLIGDYAFAIWDRQEKSFICVRDRIGIKPLHYTWDHETFAFASEGKALFSQLGGARPDDEMVASFLSFRNFKEEHQHRSFYAGVRRLPPAHYLHLQNGKLKIRRYWNFDLSKQHSFKNEAECVAAFREIFTEAVRCRLRSKNSAAAYLSGGLDSSAIVSTAGQLKEHSLQALNFYSEDPKTDERPYASEVAVKANVPVHMLFCRTQNFETGMNEFLAQVEAPMINTSRNLEPYQFLQERGWRVVLSGEGGDQIMDEFGFASDLLIRLRLPEFFSKSRRFAADFADRPADFMKESLMRLLPESWLHLSRRIRKNLPPAWVNPALVKELGLVEKLEHPDEKPRFQSFSQAANYDEAVKPYAVMKLELDERAHAHYGLEPRFPFLDSRVIEFILAMPWETRASGNRKELLRKAMEGIMPDSVVNRHDKATHTAETDRALNTFCRRELPEPVQNRSGKMGRYADLKEAAKLVDRYLAGQRDVRFEVWFLITVDHWLSNFSKGDLHVCEKTEETEIHHA